MAATPNLLEDLSEKCLAEGDCDLCDFIGIFTKSSDIILYLSGIFAVVMFVYGGTIMVASYGNDARYKWGKDVVLAVVIGLFIVTMAWTLVNTIIFSIYGSKSDAFAKVTGEEKSNLDQWSICP